jgi:hypothetical protein
MGSHVCIQGHELYKVYLCKISSQHSRTLDLTNRQPNKEMAPATRKPRHIQQTKFDMPGSHDTHQDDVVDEKRARLDIPRPTMLGGARRGNANDILGQTPEYNGWDVYNNEAIKVDTELVKDWTASLNFLLLFVSFLALHRLRN